MFHRIIFILLIVSSPSRNFYCCTGCFQSNINIACRNTQNAARKRSVVKIPSWVEKFVLGWLANILCVRKPAIKMEKSSNEGKSRDCHGDIQILAQEPTMSAEEHALLPMNHVTPVCRSIAKVQKRLSLPNGMPKNSEQNSKRTEEDIAKDLTVLADHTKLNRQIDENQKKWKHVAMVMDRFFFWFFVITVLISTLVIFKEKIRQESSGSSRITS